MITVTLQQWGNSQGIRIPKQLLKDIDLAVGQEVNLQVQDGTLLVYPAKKRYTLQELIAKIPEDYEAEEVNWGDPQGKEVW